MHDPNRLIKWLLIIALVVISLAVLYPPNEKLKGGIDLVGGTSLLFEIDTTGLDPSMQRDLSTRVMHILKDRVDRHVALVDEDEIKSATRWMVAQHQYLVEPTAAVTLAACLRGRIGKLAGPTVVLVCGRNVSLKTAMDCL